LSSFKYIVNFEWFFHTGDFYIETFIYLQGNIKRFLILDPYFPTSCLLINSAISKNVYSSYLVDPITKNSKILTLASSYENYIT
jgi:hypothetical protein